ncbi:MAG: transcription termination/antitermination protein NusG [bacterium]|nr:transcription termination/antitermination protein NusG [bacterium]
MKRWYVVQVYAGYEQIVLADLKKRIQESEYKDLFGQVIVPSAKLKQLFETVDAQDQQLFPGYVLIEMEISPETMRLVTSNVRVMRFLGGKDPVPLAPEEVKRIVSQMKGEIAVSAQKEEFTEGSEIDILDGPFAGFVGIVEKVDQENEKLTVMVSIFGRMTPVELSFNQIKR